ncbi:MAG: membrane protein insertase YidC [Alphaproteobacteria bacterium]|nr:membrane protein insertase YidC [Alphaproteobacteria bacterium]
MQDNRNIIIAAVLAMAILFGWQYLVAGPQMEQAQRQAELAVQQQAEQADGAALATPDATATGEAGTMPAGAGPASAFESRADAVAASARVMIDTPALAGSINLTGGRIDDLSLKDFHETVDPGSPIITLLSPAGAPQPYFAEQGWVAPADTAIKVPTTATQWSLAEGSETLTVDSPVTLVYDNGDGLTFRRTFAVDAKYLFTITQAVENKSGDTIALYPYARVSRLGKPAVQNFFIQHEGPVGVLGANNYISRKYDDLKNEQQVRLDNTTGWLGITDKYWATTVIAEPGSEMNALFSWRSTQGFDEYQTSFVSSAPVVVADGATGSSKSYVFAGAKVEEVISGYDTQHGFDRLDLLIDWGWFHFLTYPLFWLLRWLYGILGNFGLAIMAVTVLVKLVFFPLANRSYASMARMRVVQPQLKLIQEQYKDDKAAQQKAMMELYAKEKINPIAGCWPVLIQIPVFFSLYTVIFISLEMRHAEFYGWIRDLAAPDPTNIFTLFGLIPYDPTAIPLIGSFLHLGFWPLVMGITMWVQMKLNPPPPDPSQAMIFNLMPILFTFMLGSFPAGLVIYWAWNNFLSLLQQWVIMKRNGAEVDLFGNILQSLGLRKSADGKPGN